MPHLLNLSTVGLGQFFVFFELVVGVGKLTFELGDVVFDRVSFVLARGRVVIELGLRLLGRVDIKRLSLIDRAMES